MKPYSEETANEIDQEVKSLVESCYAQTKALLESKRELISALAEKLLEKESINLPEIMKVLGDRPFPLKESIKEYLEEIEKRQQEEQSRAAEAHDASDGEANEDEDKRTEAQPDDDSAAKK